MGKGNWTPKLVPKSTAKHPMNVLTPEEEQAAISRLGENTSPRPVPTRTARRITASERRVQALELRKRGYTQREIAVALGVTHGRVAQLISEAMRMTLTEPAKEVREMELQRLDRMQAAIWNESVGAPDATGKPTPVNLWAVDRVLKIMERRAKLLGLDAPPVVTTVMHSTGTVDRTSMLAELKANDLDPTLRDQVAMGLTALLQAAQDAKPPEA